MDQGAGYIELDEIDISPVSPDNRHAPVPLWKRHTIRQKWGMAALGTGLLLSVILAVALGTQHQSPSPRSGVLGSDRCPAPPLSLQSPITTTVGNVSHVDTYGWMTPGDPRVMALVELEQAYTNAYFSGLDEQARASVNEDLRRDRVNFTSLAAVQALWTSDRFVYWINSSLSYGIYMRCPFSRNASLSAVLSQVPSQADCTVLLDLNQEVKPKEGPKGGVYLALGAFEVSPNEDHIAYTLDRTGNEQFEVHVKDLIKGDGQVKMVAQDAYYSMRWLGNQLVFYQAVETKTQMPSLIYRVNVTSGERVLQYNETTPFLTADVGATNDQSYLLINSSSETRLIYLDAAGQPVMTNPVIARQDDVSYTVEHHQQSLYIRINDGDAVNYRVAKVPFTANTSLPLNMATAETVIAHSPSVYLQRIELFADFLFSWQWKNGSKELFILDLKSSQSHVMETRRANPVYAIMPGTNSDMDSRIYRHFNSSTFLFNNASLLQPSSLYAYTPSTRLIEPINIATDTSAIQYVEQRLLLPSFDGTLIPVDIVVRRDQYDDNQGRPKSPLSLVVRAYGAYGTMEEPTYDAQYFALVDRNMSVAWINPRGDGNNGQQYYFGGRRDRKIVTILDVRRCILELVRRGWTQPGRIGLMGRSAGGLVAGAAAAWWSAIDPGVPTTQPLNGTYPAALAQEIIAARNASAENRLLAAVVAQVPFVDVINVMLNASTPWVAYEWYEWGDPRNETIYKAMLDYAPYEIVTKRAYAPLMLSGGLKDSRVSYIEPLKLSAKYRANKMNEGCDGDGGLATPLVVRIGDYGHFGPTGGAWYDYSSEWISFLLHHLGALKK